MFNLKPQIGGQKEKKLFVFVTAFLIMAVAMLPVIIYCKGLFLYYGDFNSQQLAFYEHCHDYIRNNGAAGWDWGTDIGSSFIGSYAFYLLGSPFFWLTLPFKTGAVVYLIPWLLALKTAVAALTSYVYLRRFVKTPNAAAIGALLYALSGFQLYNVFFNHFHDITAVFPLVLLALEMRVQDNRKGVFAAAVALCAFISYYFFAGIVVFTIIYFIVRCFDKNFRITLGKFFSIALEAVVGVMLAAVLLLPAVLAVMGNPRLEESLVGMDMVVYSDSTRLLRILQSFFMLPDPPARSNIFNPDSARWASIAGYLPLFSMAGVIAFFREKKKHWAKTLIIVCAVFAAVPFLNSSFQLFNGCYYARWYYMPVLILCLATALALDNKNISLRKGFMPTAIAIGLFTLVGLLPTRNAETKEIEFGKMARYNSIFILQIVITFISLALLAYFVYSASKRKKTYYKSAKRLSIIALVICTCSMIWCGAVQGPYPENYADGAINGEISLPKEEGQFFRIDTSPDYDNWTMFWGYSSMRCFQSTVSPSIMTFYESLGITRNVASRVENKYYTLRGFLSTKYYLNRVQPNTSADKEEYAPVEGFKYYDTQNGFDIYENQYYLPMGFAYTKYISLEDIKESKLYSSQQKANLTMEAVYLTDEQIEKYSDILTEYEGSKTTNFTDFKKAYNERKVESCYYFKKDSDGFDAKIKLDEDRLVFFSVPYDEGFTATVNGKEVEVENVFDGLMAIRVPAGDNEIRFDFETPGLKYGVIISATGVLILVAYLFIAMKYDRKKKNVVGRNVEYNYESYEDHDETESSSEEVIGEEDEKSLDEKPDEETKEE